MKCIDLVYTSLNGKYLVIVNEYSFIVCDLGLYRFLVFFYVFICRGFGGERDSILSWVVYSFCYECEYNFEY